MALYNAGQNLIGHVDRWKHALPANGIAAMPRDSYGGAMLDLARAFYDAERDVLKMAEALEKAQRAPRLVIALPSAELVDHPITFVRTGMDIPKSIAALRDGIEKALAVYDMRIQTAPGDVELELNHSGTQRWPEIVMYQALTSDQVKLAQSTIGAVYSSALWVRMLPQEGQQ